MVSIAGPQGVPVTQTTMITGTNNALVSATISGPDASYFGFTDAACNGMQTCNPGTPLPTPYNLGLGCTPDGTTRMAMLTVNGNMSDMDTALLECKTNASGPGIDVYPTSLDAMNVRVGQMEMSNLQFTIESTGDQDLMATTMDSSSQWDVTQRTAGCTIAPTTTKLVPVHFAPTVFGPDN